MTPAFRAAIEAATTGLKREYSRQIGHASNDGWLDEFVAKAAIRAFDAAVAEIQRLRAEVARLTPPLPKAWSVSECGHLRIGSGPIAWKTGAGDRVAPACALTGQEHRAIAAHYERKKENELR